MSKYLMAFLIFLFWWAIVGTAISILFALVGINNLGAVGSVMGFGLGVYFGYKKIKT